MDRRPFADVGGKADMPSGRRDVCLGPRADIVDALGGRRLYSCRQIFTAEIKRIAASIGSSTPFGTIPSNGATDSLNATPVGADTSQQTFLTTPQHA